MSDPFTFDPSRVRREIFTQDQWDIKKVSYPLPTGEMLEEMRVVGGGGGGICFAGQIPENVPADAITLWLEFQNRVTGLSAHKRLEWITASRQKPPE